MTWPIFYRIAKRNSYEEIYCLDRHSSIKILSNSNSGLDDYAVANKFCYLANRYSWESL